ncbi:hypothetical protein [Streptomyces lavendulae]
MKHSTSLDPLAENAAIAVCALAAGRERWSSGAVEDAATALEVLAGALSEFSPEAAELLEVVPAAVAAIRERVEHARAATVPTRRRTDAATDPAVPSTGLRRGHRLDHAAAGHPPARPCPPFAGRADRLPGHRPGLLSCPGVRCTPPEPASASC